MSKKSVENSPQTTIQKQSSVVTESSGRPPTVFKKPKKPGHTKNAMSTHIKKKEYFYTREDEFQNDIDEFPTTSYKEHKKKQQRKTANDRESEDDESSVFKYKEYKKMYFDDSKQKYTPPVVESNYATEQNKYKKLLSSHFSKGKQISNKFVLIL